MKIKLSKSQWEEAGIKAGWIKKAQYEEKMMPGQTPYTDEEKKQLHKLVSDAAEGDQGEAFDESDANISRRRTVRVTFSDGDSLVTGINGTKQEIIKYYLPYGDRGPEQDYDTAHPDRTRHVNKVEFID